MASVTKGNTTTLRSLAFGLIVAGFDLLGASLAGIIAPNFEGEIFLRAHSSRVAVAGGYRRRLVLHALDDLPTLVVCLAVGVTLTVLTIRAIGQHDPSGSGWIFVLAWLILIPFFRKFAYLTIGLLRSRAGYAHRTLVIGSSQPAVELVEDLRRHPEYGLNPVGYTHPRTGSGLGLADLPDLGNAEDVLELTARHQIDTILVDAEGIQADELTEIVRAADRADADVFLIPSEPEILAGVTRQHIRGVPLVRLPRRAYHTIQWRVKRLFDIVASGAALLVLGPVLLAAMFLVKRETRSGGLFRQVRVGIDGESFELLKIQTMKPATTSDSDWQNNDANRIGPVGRFLRKTSIDELPQLLNIFRGEMSVVGPRPERPFFVETFADRFPHYVARHRVPCGLTGLSQVSGLRGDTSIEERTRYDNLYIERWSLWLDVKII